MTEEQMIAAMKALRGLLPGCAGTLRTYASELISNGVKYELISPEEAYQIWTRLASRPLAEIFEFNRWLCTQSC